jgi:hypothetical protein
METRSLLQCFAVDKNGRVRAVEEVARGLACDCVCPTCGEAVVAKQGEIRGWHFAHVSGAECVGAAESALHQAAKQTLVDARGMHVPESHLSHTDQLPRRSNVPPAVLACRVGGSILCRRRLKGLSASSSQTCSPSCRGEC